MRQGRVQVQEVISAAPADAWRLFGDFGGHWHPYIEWVRTEHDADGHQLRTFKARGEEAVYRERLTYFSDSDMELRYVHVSGIKDVKVYQAQCRVEPAPGGGSRITWTAQFSAPELRVDEIAEGTAAIFRAGISSVAEMASRQPMEPGLVAEPAAELKKRAITGTPRLTITASPDKSGLLLLFLHGIGGNRGNWHKQLQAVAQHVQAAALDFRGYGESERGDSASTIDAYCDDILRVMRALGKENVILCGLSYGSWVATSFAMRHPNHLRGLVLSGGCTGMSEASHTEREAFLLAREKPLNEGKTPADFANDVVKVIAGPNADRNTLRELKESTAAIPAATYRDAVHCFTHPPERFDFGKIACPVLLMTGEHDRLARPEEIRNIARRIHAAQILPDVRFEVIAGAGHVCNIEAPQQYNMVLCAFVERLLS